MGMMRERNVTFYDVNGGMHPTLRKGLSQIRYFRFQKKLQNIGYPIMNCEVVVLWEMMLVELWK